jgi:hypothetical protein
MQIEQRQPLRFAEQRRRSHDESPQFLAKLLDVTLGGDAPIPFFHKTPHHRVRRRVDFLMRPLRRCETLSLRRQLTVALLQALVTLIEPTAQLLEFPIQPLMLCCDALFRLASVLRILDEAGRSSLPSRSERPRYALAPLDFLFQLRRVRFGSLQVVRETVVSRLHLVGPALFLPTLQLRLCMLPASSSSSSRSVAFFFRSRKLVAYRRKLRRPARRAASHSSSVPRKAHRAASQADSAGFLRSSALASPPPQTHRPAFVPAPAASALPQASSADRAAVAMECHHRAKNRAASPPDVDTTTRDSACRKTRGLYEHKKVGENHTFYKNERLAKDPPFYRDERSRSMFHLSTNTQLIATNLESMIA